MPRRPSALVLATALALSACRAGGTPPPVAAGPSSPSDAPSGLVAPRPKSRECIGNTLRIPRRLAGTAMTLVAHLAISARGQARVVRVEGTDDQALADALAVAVAGCPFEPATLYGEPVEAPYVLPIRFATR